MNSQTHYDVLKVRASASERDIQAAYERLLRHLTSQPHGLSREEASRQIDLVNQAYWILSDKDRRAGYDSALTAPDADVQFSVEIRESRWTPQKILLFVIGSLIAFGMAMQIAFTFYSYYRARQVMERQNVEQSAIAVREKAEAEKRRRQAEENQLAAEERHREREQQEAQRKLERELEENRRYAEQVSRDLRVAEERAKREAENNQRRTEQEERLREQAEQRRIEQQKYIWRNQLRR